MIFYIILSKKCCIYIGPYTIITRHISTSILMSVTEIFTIHVLSYCVNKKSYVSGNTMIEYVFCPCVFIIIIIYS